MTDQEKQQTARLQAIQKSDRITIGKTHGVFPTTPESASKARHDVAEMMTRSGMMGDLSSDVELVTTELVGNVLRHSGSPDFAVLAYALEDIPQTGWESPGGIVLLMVTDRGNAGERHEYVNYVRGEASEFLPRKTNSRRGLAVVDFLSSHWEVSFCSLRKRTMGPPRCPDHGIKVDHTTVSVMWYIEKTDAGVWRRR